MENENITNEPKKKIWKKILLYVLIAVAALGIVVGGYFLYKYFFPTDKELFIIAWENTLKDFEESNEAERFQNTTSVSFDTEGEFSNTKASDALKTASINIETVNLSDDKKRFDISVNLLEKELISSQYVKVSDTESLYIPQLAQNSYCADSYLDVLSLVLGSAESSDIDLTEGIDRKKLEKYYDKYTKKLYKNIPDSDFSAVEKGDIKIITLKADLNRAAYDVLREMREDGELRDFLYEQTNLVANNIKNKYPYVSMFISIPQKTEFNEDYKTTIDNTIKSIENAEITVTIDVNKERRIEKTQMKVTNNDKEIFLMIHSPQQFDVLVNGEDKMLFKMQSATVNNGTVSVRNATVSFDVNDLTKEKTETPKIVSININSKTDTNVTKEVKLPENCIDIRTASQEEKNKITEQASEKFVALLTDLVTKLFT